MGALSPSLEDYLEAIWMQGLKEKVVRVKDLAKNLNVKPPSVIGALKILVDRGLVTHEKYGYIELTQNGIELAKNVYEKHKILCKFFHEILGVDSETAVSDACQIEHYIDRKTMDRLVKFIEFIETCPEGEPQWLSSLHYFLKTGKRPESCSKVKEALLSGGEKMKVCTLDNLNVGQKGKVKTIAASSNIKRRLLDMGIVPGAEVRIEKVAPLGDPIDIVVKGYHLSLRRDEASAITMEAIE